MMRCGSTAECVNAVAYNLPGVKYIKLETEYN